jgi:hypothetical protein
MLAVALFPATSEAVTVTASEPCVICNGQVKFPPEIVAAVPLHDTVARPESPSLANPLTTMLAEGFTLPSAGDVMLTNGGV